MTEQADIPMPEASPEAAPVAKANPAGRGGGFLGLLAGGVQAAGMGFGLSMYLLPQGWQPAAPDVTLIDRLAAVEKAVASLPAPDVGLADRVAAVEAELAKPAPPPDCAPNRYP